MPYQLTAQHGISQHSQIHVEEIAKDFVLKFLQWVFLSKANQLLMDGTSSQEELEALYLSALQILQWHFYCKNK